MGKQCLVVLGSAPALSDAHRDNTYLLLDSPRRSLFVDCAGSPFHKLLHSGLDPRSLEGVLLTHSHPDHLYGLPSLVHELWLSKRKEPLHIYANAQTRRVAEGLLHILELEDKPFPLLFHPIPEERNFLLMDNEEYTIHTTPVEHFVPTVAVRIAPKVGHKVATYSSDTRPCEALLELATGSDLLFLECTVSRLNEGHLTPEEVGEIAGMTAAKELILVHCPPSILHRRDEVLAAIAKNYGGPVRLANDFDSYRL